MTDVIRTADQNDEPPEQVVIDGLRYQRIDRIANRLGAHLMYDCHAFRRARGATVREIVEDWRSEHDEPKGDGPPNLCPIIVLDGGKELRRVGKMVHASYPSDGADRRQKQREAVADFIRECEADPDIPRLLASGRNCSE